MTTFKRSKSGLSIERHVRKPSQSSSMLFSTFPPSFPDEHLSRASLRDPAPVPHAADHPKAGPSSVQSPTTPTSITSPISPEIASISTQPTLRLSQPQSPSSFHDLNPANYAPAHESRRRNAEQRAATLRADTLIGEVEPNRVFCSLCQKWVQLRQDSSYCAYPWLQHRGKCLARQYVIRLLYPRIIA